MKRKFYVFIAVLCLSIMLPLCASAFEGGSGTSSDPFLVSTEEQLRNIVYMPTKAYKLVNNIELTRPWKCIDNFSGTLDGNGYEVTNLFELEESNKTSLGFIGCNSGTIENLTIRTAPGFEINGEKLSEAGILVGNNRKTVKNCAVYGELASNAKYVGGLVGNITYIYNDVMYYAIVSSSYAMVDVMATNSDAYVGGFAGNSSSEDVSHCYSAGDVSGGNVQYGFGNVSSKYGKGCFYDISLCGVEDQFAEGMVTYAMKQEATYTKWDFEEVWGIDPTYNDGYPYLQINYEAQMSAPRLSVTSAYGVTGHDFDVYVNFENNPGVAAFILSLEYDNSVMTPVNIETASVLADFEVYSNIDENPDGKLYLTFTNASSIKDDGAVLKITFNVLPEAELGETKIKTDVDSIIDQNYKDLRFTLKDGIVTISDILMGDVLNDGVIDMRDALKLSRYLAKQSVSMTAAELKAADVYPDGVLDSKDALKLSQYLAGWENISLGIK